MAARSGALVPSASVSLTFAGVEQLRRPQIADAGREEQRCAAAVDVLDDRARCRSGAAVDRQARRDRALTSA